MEYRRIREGDDLSGKVVYFDVSSIDYLDLITSTDMAIVLAENPANSIEVFTEGFEKTIRLTKADGTYEYFLKYDTNLGGELGVTYSTPTMIMPDDFGVVTTIIPDGIGFNALSIAEITTEEKEVVKGYCEESRCAYDVYTRLKSDELLGKKIDRGNIAVLSDFIEPEVGTLTLFYPTGFNKDNCIVISFAVQHDSEEWDYQYVEEEPYTSTIRLGEEHIYIQDSYSNATIRSYKIVLMKIA